MATHAEHDELAALCLSGDHPPEDLGLFEWSEVRPGVIDQAMIDVFTQGYCGLLGIALAERSGWELVALGWEPDDLDEPDFPWFHVMCRRPQGDLVDIEGVRTVGQVREEWRGIDCLRPISSTYIEDCLAASDLAPETEIARRLAASVADRLIERARMITPPAHLGQPSRQMTAAGRHWLLIDGTWQPAEWHRAIFLSPAIAA